jgi:hypothetical protein
MDGPTRRSLNARTRLWLRPLTTCVLVTLTFFTRSPIPASAEPQFATEIVQFHPGSIDVTGGPVDTASCAGGGAAAVASYCLGSPDQVYLSIGELGQLTVGFGDFLILDGPGDDFVLWGSCNAPNEPGLVLASPNGVAFSEVGVFDAGVRMYFDLGRAGLPRLERYG